MKKLTLIITGTILFNILFWDQGLGLNLLLFAVFILINIFIDKEKPTRSLYIVLIGYLISTSLVVIHNSTIATILSFISLILVIGLRNNSIKSIHYGLMNTIAKYVQSLNPSEHLQDLNLPKNTNIKTVFRYFSLTIIPILLLVLFLTIFIHANPFFEKVYDNFIEQLILPFQKISISKVLFIVWSLTITLWITIKYTNKEISKNDLSKKDVIQRLRIEKKRYSFTTLGLKKEYITAIIFFVMINILLLVVNIVDINWVWINFKYNFDFNISQFVHEGTYLLIFSVLLSIGILSFYYRRNLNFYSNNTLLKRLSYLWIAQNIILVLSVAMRNLHYIEFHGLTNKRIGVFIFLIITTIGLITIGLKIKRKNSFHYYFKTNTWALYITLIVCSLPNWDHIITKHNLEQKEGINYYYLTRLSDKTLPLLDEYRNDFNDAQIKRIDNRINNYKHKQLNDETWLSWDYASYKTNKYFNDNK